MHIAAENAVFEVVDVKTLKPLDAGSPGLLLVTDLNNFSMPRLRYQLGDIAALSGEKCSCGITLPIMDKIQGREDDMFVSAKGAFIHGHYFNHIARNLHSIKQFQIRQHTRDKLSLKIIRSANCDDGEIHFFLNEIHKAMGDVELNMEFVERIPVSPSGKLRYAIREFPLVQ
jgi:phenylacetate-CoA ligase